MRTGDRVHFTGPVPPLVARRTEPSWLRYMLVDRIDGDIVTASHWVGGGASVVVTADRGKFEVVP